MPPARRRANSFALVGSQFHAVFKATIAPDQGGEDYRRHSDKSNVKVEHGSTPQISHALDVKPNSKPPGFEPGGRVLDCASGRQIVERFQFPRFFVDAPLQVTSSAWLGINRGMPSARIGVNGDTQIRLAESTADHVRKLNGAFLFVGHHPALSDLNPSPTLGRRNNAQ